MKRKLIRVMSLCACLTLSSCYYDTAEELQQYFECDSQNMSFQQDIYPIVTQYCLQCHSANNPLGGIQYENYEDVMKDVNNGSFMGSIRHTAGFSPMPPGGTLLPACTVEKLESWINANSPNN